MLAWGLIPTVGPITVAAGSRPGAGGERYTVEEIGDALGYFISRVAELTYTPTPKFTPYLMGDGSGTSGSDRSK